jgi:hypothetical protein
MQSQINTQTISKTVTATVFGVLTNGAAIGQLGGYSA